MQPTRERASGRVEEPPRLRRLLAALEEAVGNPPVKARLAVETGRVVRLTAEPLPRWLVMGERGDYVVVERHYCSCPDFTIRTVMMHRPKPCYHIVAVELAKKRGRYHDLADTLTPRLVSEIVYETITSGSSPTIRRLLHQYGEAAGETGERGPRQARGRNT